MIILCSVDGCERKSFCKGLCGLHYERVRTTGEVGSPAARRRGQPVTPRVCSVEGCARAHDAQGYCSSHYAMYRRYGDPEHPPGRVRSYAGMQCKLEGCMSKARSIGYCSEHYRRDKRWGAPDGKRPVASPRKTPQGYVQEYNPKHPNACKNGTVSQHVRVMSDMLGRSLISGENVHHKNGVRDDNRPDNLELWVTHQPSGQRPADLVEWAKEILRRYGDEDGLS
jgi:HNH endonuclease